MRIVIFTPYGMQSPEYGLAYFMARYLHDLAVDLVQLRCNGVFSLCDRDVETGWRRDMHSCLRCMKDQDLLANWAGVKQHDLSHFLKSDEIEETKRWISVMPPEALQSARWEGVSLYALCEDSLGSRLSGAAFDLNNKQHEPVLRRYLLSAARMLCATKRFNNQVMPDLVIVAGGQDAITRTFIEQVKRQKIGVAVMRWDVTQRAIQISHPYEDRFWPCPFVIENIKRMRGDIRTWPREITAMLSDVQNFLGISEHQLTLPIAK